MNFEEFLEEQVSEWAAIPSHALTGHMPSISTGREELMIADVALRQFT